MNHRILTALTLAAGIILIAPALIAQSSAIPRTEYGVPDFQGTYTYRTLTPLNRPRGRSRLSTGRDFLQ